jgi:hypothetical protein
MSIPSWVVDLIRVSPYVGVPIFAIWMIVKNWCILLAGTMAVLHKDPKRREDAREVIKLLRAKDEPNAEIENGAPVGKAPAPRPRSKPSR